MYLTEYSMLIFEPGKLEGLRVELVCLLSATVASVCLAFLYQYYGQQPTTPESASNQSIAMLEGQRNACLDFVREVEAWETATIQTGGPS